MDATMTETGKRSSTTAFAIIAGVFCLLHLLPTYLSSWLWIAGFVILALSMFLRMKNVLPAIGFAVLAVDRVVCMAVYGVIDVISILWTLIFLLAAVICFASLTNIMPMQREAFRRLWFLPAVLSAVKWVIAIVWTLHKDSRRILSYGFAEYLSSSGIISTLLQGAFITALMLFALLWAANPDGIPSKGTSKAYCNMALHILLLLFSCGIWYWIWNYRMTRDTNAVRDEAERNPVTKLLLCMFIPFYGIYWTYKTAQRIDKMAWDRNIPSSTAALCLIMEFFLPIVPPIVMPDDLRDIADIAVKHEYGLDIGAQALRQPLVVAHSGDNGVALQGFIKSLFQISFRLPPYSGFCQMQKKHSKHAARFVRLSPCSILRAFF